ncbi:NAD-dependent epimerase/dehydratase family protein [Labilibacter sediminis]|nr:NAD-dependent epimerase/dehydratase family protein [Labilibacter sediminis]
MKRVFVTGSTGYVGSKLIEELAITGYQVHALYRDEKKLPNIKHKNIVYYKGDLDDIGSLQIAMRGCEGLFHTAALARLWAKDVSVFYKVNVEGTKNVIAAAKEAGITKAVFTTSAGVLGPAITKPIAESQLNPLPFISDYERSKYLADEAILKAQSDTFKPILVYPTRIFGPGLLGESNSVSLMIHRYILGKWHFIPGNGQAVGNYVYIDDVVKGHIQAYERGAGGEGYLLGGTNLSYIDFFNHLKKVSGLSYSLFKIPLWLMKLIAYLFLVRTQLTGIPPLITSAFVKKFVYDWEVNCEKSMALLDYSPTSFEKALSETVYWLKDDIFGNKD